jgi:hypothetical protein
MTASQIEAMVEKKVGEILAARKAVENGAPEKKHSTSQHDVSEAMQRRLEALERRIESEDNRVDSKSDGLRFLLAARQHREKGDDASALRAYEMALPFFPGQAKLIGKIQRLRNRLGISAEHTSVLRSPMRSPLRHDRKSRRQRFTINPGGETSDHDEADVEEEFLDDQTIRIKSRKSRSKSMAKLQVYDDVNETTTVLGAGGLVPSRELVTY